jgi:molybdopterin adenylyltransferase
MKSGKVLHVCISDKRGTIKRSVSKAALREDHGVVGDAHAGGWHRQVSLLDDADIEAMRAKGLDLQPGAFGENLIVRGLDLSELGIGSRLKVGRAELELTQVGKVCHEPCAIGERTGDCIMPRAGIFARVLRGGEVKRETPIEVIEEIPRSLIQAAVITVSDRCSAGAAEDTAGPAVARLLEEKLDVRIAAHVLIPDDLDAIINQLIDLTDRGYDLACTVGGTGFGPRDVTPEATRAVIEREAPGLGEAMRAASLRKTPHAMLQRGLSGIRGNTLVVNLPGSERGASENLAAILDAMPHAARLLRSQTHHEP